EFSWGPCNGSTIINFNGVAVEPSTTLSAEGLDFGQVDISDPAQRQSLIVRNTGDVPRTITGINLGTSNELLLIQPDLSAFPITLTPQGMPGDELTIEVEYSPQTK